jgi:hypothetical protein
MRRIGGSRHDHIDVHSRGDDYIHDFYGYHIICANDSAGDDDLDEYRGGDVHHRYFVRSPW